MLTMDLLLSGDSEEIRKEILSIDLQELSKHINDAQYKNYFLAGPGREHYKLIAATASLFPGKTVFDVGTHFGLSSIAMSMNPEVHVISYDILEMRRLHSTPPNITYKFGDFCEDPEVLASPFILIDVDPHDGVQEQYFHESLIEKKYRGIVMWDDINVNKDMEKWWGELRANKWDITNAGHWSGTGIIRYG